MKSKLATVAAFTLFLPAFSAAQSKSEFQEMQRRMLEMQQKMMHWQFIDFWIRYAKQKNLLDC